MVVVEDRVSFLIVEEPIFSCELGGSSMSLLGTGVEILEEDGFSLGIELALVVSFKQDD
jgi:hypothetical protein